MSEPRNKKGPAGSGEEWKAPGNGRKKPHRPASGTESISQELSYQRVPEGLKDAAVNMLEQPAEALRARSDFIGENRSESYNQLETKIHDVQTIGHALNTGNRQQEIITGLKRESGRYMAGDLLFNKTLDKDEINALKKVPLENINNIGEYIEKAKMLGIPEGYTVGVHKAFLDVSRHPEEYFAKGTVELDKGKVLEKIKTSECYKIDNHGHMIPVVRYNKRWRDKIQKAQEYQGINALEQNMKNLKDCGIFTAQEEKILSENNRMFQFSSLADIERSSVMVDKYLVEQIRIAAAPGDHVVKIGTKELFRKELGEVNLKRLGRMSSRDVRKLIKKLTDSDGKPLEGCKEIVDALNAKNLLTVSAEKIHRLGGVQNIGKTGVMILGGDELMSSDFGTAVNQVKLGVNTGRAAAKAGMAGASLAGGAAVKAADLVAPDGMDAVRAFKKDISLTKEKAVLKGVEKIRGLPPIRVIQNGKVAAASSASGLAQKLSATKPGKIAEFFWKHGGRATQQASEIIRKPFAVTGRIMDTVKRKVIVPAAIVIGLIFIFNYIVAGLGGAVDSTVTSVLVTVLAEDEQLADYQATYDAQDAVFQNQVSAVVNGFAATTNKRGAAIPYGINTVATSTLPDGTATGLTTTAEYKNGITMNYYYDGSASSGISSNIEDCISAMAVIMSQEQAEHHTEALELLESIYKSTHSYTTTESALYPCTGGCEITLYYCNEHQINYESTDMRYQPWLFGDELVDGKLPQPTAYASETNPGQECVVCRSGEKGEIPYEEYAGCTVVGTCYHNEDEDGNLGRRKPTKCTNYIAIYDCPGHDHEDSDGNTETTYCTSAIGCKGYYECRGHDHWGCPNGHTIATCFGHVDLDMSVWIASLNRIFEMGGVPVVESETTSSGTSETDASSNADDNESEDDEEAEEGDDGPGSSAVYEGDDDEEGNSDSGSSSGAIWTGFASCESGSEGFRQAGGDGGHAYGLFQFDDRYDLFPFLGVCLSHDSIAYNMFSPLYTKYINTGVSIVNDSTDLTAMIQAWHNAYDQDPEDFSQLQLNRFVSVYYTPCISYFSNIGVDISSDDYSPVIRGTAMSISIWAGPSGAQKVINRLSSSMTEPEMLDMCYSDYTAELKGTNSKYISSFRTRWTSTQKTLAAQAYTKWLTGSDIPTTSSENILTMLAGSGITYGIDGGTYIDYIREWINRYTELSQEFRDNGGWNSETKEWCGMLRNAGDWFEIYGIVGNGQLLDLTVGTSGGYVIDGSVDVNAENYEVPDNGGSMPIVYYSQGGGQPWSALPFGGGNIASSGCSITSLAMVVSYLTAGTDMDGWVYPSDIRAMIEAKTGNYNTFYDYENNTGQNWDIMGAVAGYYGLNCSQISSSSITASLAAGKPVIMSCVKGEFTNGGHFIVLTGLTDDGYIVVNDPSHPDKSYKKYTASYIASQGKGWWSFSK